MKNRICIIFTLVLLLEYSFIQAQNWAPVPGQIMTNWANDVTPENVWKEYPRPQMVRTDWLNLNGLWDFEITDRDTNKIAINYARKILVPFCVESALSGIKETITGKQQMMYRRYFTVPSNWNQKYLILHFEAVDYETKVWVDGKYVGMHKGGYDHFQFDITGFLSKEQKHEIKIVVWDPTNEGSQPIGKQALPAIKNVTKYTATSGIWQTVWLEPINDVAIESIKIIPNIDNATISLQTKVVGATQGTRIKIQAFDQGKEIASSIAAYDELVSLQLNQPKLWSPTNPFLYDLKLTLIKEGKVVDEVSSYFGMRKISMGRDQEGYMRILLNNEIIYQLGPLDQGYWPDGILTPASDQALRYDIAYLKKIGANMDRMHMKVQPERWYYHCDQLGILVWQDMVSPTKFIDTKSNLNSSDFELEHNITVDQLYNHPSIIQWVLFNESWGQYDTERLTAALKAKDPTRLVINASGWHDKKVGDIRDFHDYTIHPAIALVTKNDERAMVLGEAGGFDLLIPGHLWTPDLKTETKLKTDWTIDFKKGVVKSADELIEKYTILLDDLFQLKKYGLNAVVYTQISDVEDEISGWMTYDRKVGKLPDTTFAALHQQFFKPTITGKYILPLSMNTAQQWNYRFTAPSNDWIKNTTIADFKLGEAPFGIESNNAHKVNTTWNTNSLFLNKEFTLTALPSKLSLVACNTGITDVYINGAYVMQFNNFLKNDPEVKISETLLSDKAMKLLKVGVNQLSLKFNFPSVGKPVYYYDFGIKEY
jgi:ribosomal protein S17E